MVLLIILLPCNICIERANAVDIDVAVWLRHECRVTHTGLGLGQTASSQAQ